MVGFDHDGSARFINGILTDVTRVEHSIAVSPAGDVYVATDTDLSDVVIDGTLLPFPPDTSPAYMARFTAQGQFAASNVLIGQGAERPFDVAVDAAGASYMSATCSGVVDVEPEITCATGDGNILVSYDASNSYLWATSVEQGSIDSIVPVAGNRVMIAGESPLATTSFGGISIATGQIFVAAVATGQPRLPSPLPPAPTVTSAGLDGVSDGAIRQGGTGTLVIAGTGLDRVTRVRLGEIDVHVPPGAGSATSLRLPIIIPHGHATGPLALTVSNAAGSAQLAAAVTVTPIVVTPDGTDSGRGTFSSPLRLCLSAISWTSVARFGDEVLLRDGTHACHQGIQMSDGVTVHGESRTGTIITGDNQDAFGGFSVFSQGLGALAIENLTFQSGQFAAIELFDLEDSPQVVNLTDVDMQGLDGSGIYVETRNMVTATRYRYLDGQGTALAVFGGRIDAHDVDVENAFRGALMTSGTLNIDGSLLSSVQPAMEIGNVNELGGTRTVAIARSTLRSSSTGIIAIAANTTLADTTIEPLGNVNEDGIELQGGALTMTGGTIFGWPSAIFTSFVPGQPAGFARRSAVGPLAPDPLDDAVSLVLDGITISSCQTGIDYGSADVDGHFSLHNALVNCQSNAVVISGQVSAIDLGTAANPGNNQLTAGASAPLIDARTAAGPAIDAHGNTLNGITFSGDVLGPVNLAGSYEIDGPNTIHF